MHNCFGPLLRFCDGRFTLIDAAPWSSRAGLARSVAMADLLAISRRRDGYDELYSCGIIWLDLARNWRLPRAGACVVGCSDGCHRCYNRVLHSDDLRIPGDRPSMAQRLGRPKLSTAINFLWNSLVIFLLQAWGNPALPQAGIAIVSGVLAMGAKIFYWRFIDTSSSSSTPESATGLGHLGQVRLFEAPHTESNYLMKEMGFRIARMHAISLRAIALTLSFAVPFSFVGASALAGGMRGTIAALIAAIFASVGIFVERWLFFAEARHTVTLYYGARAA